MLGVASVASPVAASCEPWARPRVLVGRVPVASAVSLASTEVGVASVGVAGVASVGIAAFAAQLVSGIYDRREVAPPGCTESGDCGPQGNKADILSARAAEDIVDLTVVQIWFGAVGLVLLGWTLSATRAAVREANDATEAARLAVQVTEEGTRRQLQAYVHIERAEISWGTRNGGSPSVTLYAKNTGQTPAKWFGVRVLAVMTPSHTDPTTFVQAPWRDRELLKWSALGGLSEISLPGSRSGDLAALRQAYQDQAVVHILGAVQYETMYGDIMETEFWFCRKPEHRYKSKVTGTSTLGPHTLNHTTEVPQRMQRVARAMRTYAPVLD